METLRIGKYEWQKSVGDEGQDVYVSTFIVDEDEVIGTYPSEELYDIVKDPGCRNNLAKNPEYRPVLEKIRKNMIQLLKETQDHELENYVNSL